MHRLDSPSLCYCSGRIIPPSPPVIPLKIKTIKLCDFRAFAGPEPVTISLNGKNLLVYGENGAGKSSIFHALNEFFSMAEPNAHARKSRLAVHENIFPNIGKGKVSVEIEFVNDVSIARWDQTAHPVDTVNFPPRKADARIVSGAYRKAILDYRALLDTNYRHGNEAINLFDVCVRVLLRDYPVAHNGKEERLFDFWRRMEPMPSKYRLSSQDKDNIKAHTTSINAALAEAIEALAPKANGILSDLGWGDVKLEALTMPGVRFAWARSRQDRR